MKAPRVPYTALVGLPLAVFVLAGGVALVRGNDVSLGLAYAMLGAFALAVLVQLVAVPWAIRVLVRNPALRTPRAFLAVAFGAVFALVATGIVAMTAWYAGP